MEQEGDEGQPRQHPMEESDRDAGPTFRGDEGQEAETHTSRGTYSDAEANQNQGLCYLKQTFSDAKFRQYFTRQLRLHHVFLPFFCFFSYSVAEIFPLI